MPKFILCNLSNIKPSVKKNKTPEDGEKSVCLLGNLEQARNYKEQKKERTGKKKNRCVCVHLSICPGVCRFECLSESNEGQLGQKGY